MVSFNYLKHSAETLVPISRQVDPIDSRFSPWLTPLAYPLVGGLVLPNFFKQIKVSGQENLPTDGPVILAPTHRSRWDALILGWVAGRGVTGRDLRFMVSSSEVQGIQGWFIRRLGGFPVNPKQPAIASLRHGVEILQNRQMMVIFPEGGIFRDTEVHPLKPGLARLALQAETSQPGLGVQIVPISLRYSDPYVAWRSTISIQIGAPLQAAHYNQGIAKQNAQHLTQDLETALKQLAITNDLPMT
ncbi:1-acyl-sn-glycerol-3-phosphate acyltransferase [Oscillatoria sp. FACHB-1407]|uniref:lysophospholipid acyltransferase family protein n=1 Tax=Oscillatoria sp. FACHB-1407 TaxID=2692847 RepID=UPI001682504D|nr:1-acyl-sn-glycerol-3-phosphate acyltransferase [Oscillatoria sp. FACHB-1407]MBD2462442.1 1-acyl-sn-glycerol-3-phosphate acyltransferase [Oscillatoria sp. FACHB-1407]